MPTSPPHVDSKDRRRPLLRLVQPVGDRSPYNERTKLAFIFGRRRPPFFPGADLLLLSTHGPFLRHAVSSSTSSPTPLARPRSLAFPSRAPERRAAELAAGGSPVTKWSRA